MSIPTYKPCCGIVCSSDGEYVATVDHHCAMREQQELHAQEVGSLHSENAKLREDLAAAERERDSLTMAIDEGIAAFERKERGIPQAHIAESLVGELRRTIEQLQEVPRVLPAEMTPAIREVLGLLSYTTAPIGRAFRAAGRDIQPKIEDEQAFVLWWLLGHALKHGAEWRKFAAEELPRAPEQKGAA